MNSASIGVKKSKINKRGVFAMRDFKKGEVVLEWHPKILTKTEVDKLPKSKKHAVDRIGNNTSILQQPPERFVNHSCEPNTRAKDLSDIMPRGNKLNFFGYNGSKLNP